MRVAIVRACAALRSIFESDEWCGYPATTRFAHCPAATAYDIDIDTSIPQE